MSDQEPTGTIVTTSELAQICDLTTRRVQQLAKEGVMKSTGERGQYHFLPSIQGYCKYVHKNYDDKKTVRKYQDNRALKSEEEYLALKQKREIALRLYISREEYSQAVDMALHVQSREFTILLNKFQRLVPGISDSLLKAIESALVKSHNAIIGLKLKPEPEQEEAK